MNIQNNLSTYFIAFASWFLVSDSPGHAEDRMSLSAGMRTIDQAKRTISPETRLADNRRFGTGSGWVAAEIELTPRGNSFSAGQDNREVSRFASSVSDRVIASNSEVSVLERANEGQASLNSPIGSNSATPASDSSLPSTALVGPSNALARSPSDTVPADSSASVSSSDFGDIADGYLKFLNKIDVGKCCHPQDHPSCYEYRYAISFDK